MNYRELHFEMGFISRLEMFASLWKALQDRQTIETPSLKIDSTSGRSTKPSESTHVWRLREESLEIASRLCDCTRLSAIRRWATGKSGGQDAANIQTKCTWLVYLLIFSKFVLQSSFRFKNGVKFQIHNSFQPRILWLWNWSRATKWSS